MSDIILITGAKIARGEIGGEGYNFYIRHSRASHGPDARGGAGGGHTL